LKTSYNSLKVQGGKEIARNFFILKWTKRVRVWGKKASANLTRNLLRRMKGSSWEKTYPGIKGLTLMRGSASSDIWDNPRE